MDNFNSSIFVSKANNLLKMIYNLISLNNIELIKPFVSEDVFKNIANKVKILKDNGERVNYDEVNVNCEIKEVIDDSPNLKIVVRATFKYLKYYTSIDDGRFIRGDSNNRVQVIHTVTFEKKTM